MARPFHLLSALLYSVVTPLVAAATGVTLQQTMHGITIWVGVLVFALSSVLGLASLLNMLKKETPPRLVVFVAAHMLSSWAGGLVAFVIAEWYEWNDWAEVAFICFTAYASARALDAGRDRVMDVLPAIFRLPQRDAPPDTERPKTGAESKPRAPKARP